VPFKNRADAGRRLAAALSRYGAKNPLVLALPRGGVPVAAEVAAALAAPLDLILVRKLGVPFQPELAMGAVVDGIAPHVVRNEDVIRLTGVSDAKFAEVRDRELAEIERRRQKYLGGRTRWTPEGRTAIVIDDGIATGATARAALQATRAGNPARLVLAVPVASPEVISGLRSEADEIVCLEQPEVLWAIGLAYQDFQQVTDDEVVAALARFPETSRGAASATSTVQSRRSAT
jgi:predicted phosphoribosyltransferase